MFKNRLPVVATLLLALALRVFRLTRIPPGLTHDEANHGREAIEILDGILRYYFPLNYGSEPLYSYSVATAMAALGENLFALRLVNVVAGLLTICAAYAWARMAIGRQVALIGALLMAISFWSLASSREALRAGLLPLAMTLAVILFWLILFDRGPQDAARFPKRSRWLVVGFAVAIAVTFHIYLAARVAWVVFPLFLFYLALFHRQRFRASWRPVLSGLLLAGLLVLPMFVYLSIEPLAQTRLTMLDSVWQQLLAGDLQPLLLNSMQGWLAFVWPGFGDQFLAYNIPGRPVFEPLSAGFFLIGVIVCLRRFRRPAYAFLLLWFLTGIFPSLVTGPTANTTRNLAALTAAYLLPAVGFWAISTRAARRLRWSRRWLVVVAAATWLSLAGIITVRDYFITWAESPQVRGAYQHTLVEGLQYLEKRGVRDETLLLSSVYPGAAHDPSLAIVLAGSDANQMRWMDARYALLLPAEDEALVWLPESTPVHTAFSPFLQPIESVKLREDDLDPGFTLYAIDRVDLDSLLGTVPPVKFGGAISLLGARWLESSTLPGETAELLTIWRVEDPALAGALHPPANTTETVFFTHILDQDGNIVTQRDALDAPSWGWRSGDLLLQIHPIELPAGLEDGAYDAQVGVYDAVSGVRLSPGIEDGPNRLVPPLQVAK